MTTISSSWILLLVTLLVSSLLLMATASSDEIYENRAIKSVNGDKRPFFVGSRYGRSQSDLTNMDGNGKSTNTARIVPRNDRFFFGSRYGKRSTPYIAIDANENQLLTCFYSGITNLFRCVEKMDLPLNGDDDK